MTSRARWLAGAAAASAMIVVLAMTGAFSGDSGREGDDDGREPALARLVELREAVAACNEGLAAEDARFREHQAAVDSLRAVVDGYESRERTVPADQFDEYLEAFDAYNQSVTAWPDRADELRSAWEQCRELAERHNALVDSLSAGGAVQTEPADPAVPPTPRAS